MRGRSISGLLALAAGGMLLARHAGHVLVRRDPLPRAADAIVVLAGSIADRALEAADAFRTGVAPRILITRERSVKGASALRRRGVALPESDTLLRAALEGLGVPGTAIETLRRRTFSTESESATIARVACRRGWQRLVVVTSAAHSRRAGWILRRAMGPGIEVRLRPSRYDPFPAGRWWRVRHATKVVVGEWQKLAHFWLRERWTIRSCGGLRRRQD